MYDLFQNDWPPLFMRNNNAGKQFCKFCETCTIQSMFLCEVNVIYKVRQLFQLELNCENKFYWNNFNKI